MQKLKAAEAAMGIITTPSIGGAAVGAGDGDKKNKKHH
jgi:hypothetical protein